MRNGLAGCNIDMPDVIEAQPSASGRRNANKTWLFDLNDDRWMDGIDASDGARFSCRWRVYYFRTVIVSAPEMAKRFPGAVLVFDSCNRRGTRLMMKTWLKEAGIRDVGAFFFLEDPNELNAWSEDFASVTSKSYMRGYRDIYREVGLLHKLMIRFCDSAVNMQIVKISFRPAKSWPKKMRAIDHGAKVQASMARNGSDGDAPR